MSLKLLTTLQHWYPLPALFFESGGVKRLQLAGSVVCYCLPSLLWLRAAAARYKCIFDSSQKTNEEEVGVKQQRNGFFTLAARVMLRSFITSSNAAVSSACFWLCKAIFSLNFRGLFEVAMFRSSAPFSLNCQRQATGNEDTKLPVMDGEVTQQNLFEWVSPVLNGWV